MVGFASRAMPMLFLAYLWLPLATAFPSYVDCDSDDKTTLKLGSVIMKVGVTQAPSSTTFQVVRNGKPVTTYIEGEVLQLRVSGFPTGSSAVLRSNDKSNTTLRTDSAGTFQSKCQNQIFVNNAKTLPGSASVDFRPGCGASSVLGSAQAGNLELTWLTSTAPGQPVMLSSLSLTPEGKQDPSCHGGVIPTNPPTLPPALKDANYVRLMWVHRWAVMLSWGFLFPLGVALVRYYPSGARLKLHRTIQCTGLLVEIADFTCVYLAHQIGPLGAGPAVGDEAHFSGNQGQAPNPTHKQRGFAVFMCILLQVVFGVMRPKAFPNNFVRRFWLYVHRTVGDGAIVLAWLNIWEAVSMYAGTDQSQYTIAAIVACMAMCSSMVVAPVYYMLVSSRADAAMEAGNLGGSQISIGSSMRDMSRQVSRDGEHPRDAAFFGCAYCSQVFTSKHILEVHIEHSHPGLEYQEVLSPMTQRFAEVTNMPAMTHGFPLSEVKKHNSRNDCWVVINGKVYNLTSFLNNHPGGPNPILSWAGRDASRTWNQIHDKSWLDRYSGSIECLGNLAPEPPVAGMEPTEGSSAAVLRRPKGGSHNISMTDPEAMQTNLVSADNN